MIDSQLLSQTVIVYMGEFKIEYGKGKGKRNK